MAALPATGTSSPPLLPASHQPSSELENHGFFAEEQDRSLSLIEKGEVEVKRSYVRNRQAVLSGAAYCLCSCSMVLLNKLVLSGFNLDAGISFMFYQNLVSVAIIYTLKACGHITTEPLTWKLVSIWFPVNLIFVGMLLSSIMSLKYMNIGMLTIMKNLANLITAVGDMYLFRKQHNLQVWISLLLMIVSAICGGLTDLAFSGIGYAWQITNCLLTAGYTLTLRKTMDVARKATQSGNLSEYSMVLLNNSLSLPLGLGLAFLFNEVDYLLSSSVVRSSMFWFVSTLTGFVGLAISFTSMWFLKETGPTTYR
ncbi:hypothetical protein KP509_02G005800 [Ceratopteris richardii]|uniref:Sugar phosphate transporter domain-containing protein n=1 Tax=Ceratopteris richardii TaxID=49495 RepID=A0A8T2VA96_CERRI|nr:hypothetical protein KP509_02G005800 [Ceratopteris richardii]